MSDFTASANDGPILPSADASTQQPDAQPIRFDGRWGDFIPIVAVNLLLSIVTLGIYRFWARTRVRRYLWSRTKVLGDYLEYSGTGLELFLGFLAVFLVILVPLYGLSTLAQILIGQAPLAAAAMMVGLYLTLLYLLGVAIFRAQLYRFSRTRWRGIRGGMTEGGWGFGLEYMTRMLLNFGTLGLLVPYNSIRLWNHRYNATTFGTIPMESHAKARRVYGAFFLGIVVAAVAGTAMAMLTAGLVSQPLMPSGNGAPTMPDFGQLARFFGAALALYLALGLGLMFYLAAFYREAVSSLRWGEVGFCFKAGAVDWLVFYLVNLALVAVTFGLGIFLLPYRTFQFVSWHAASIGAPDLTQLRQSQEAAPQHGEGLAEAFDLGAV